MSNLTNKIEANDRTIAEVLENKKYTVDYFQRDSRKGYFYSVACPTFSTQICGYILVRLILKIPHL